MKTKRRSGARQARPAAGRHRRKCVACNHPKRKGIDAAFLSGVSPAKIAAHFKLPSRSSVYRHAEALGLVARRRSKESLLETIKRGGRVPEVPDALLKAVAKRKKKGK
jgi:hypothetical protein